MSFLIDGPWLYASGRLIGAVVPERAQGPVAAATAATFLGVSIPLYLNRGWTTPIWRACRAHSGRDWMLNSGVLSIDAEHAGPGTHAACAAIFSTYPGWLWLGLRRERRRAKG